MEVKSISDCLNIIDDAIVENIGKYIGILSLENIHKHLLVIERSDFIENRIDLSNILSQINCIIENRYQFAEKDIKCEYIQLRKVILVWLLECSTEPKVNNQ